MWLVLEMSSAMTLNISLVVLRATRQEILFFFLSTGDFKPTNNKFRQVSLNETRDFFYLDSWKLRL